jgi:hypothetical protein
MPSSLDRDIKVTYPALPGIRLCNRQIRDGRAPQPYDLHARRCAVSATFSTKRPRCRRTAEERDELAPLHILSLAQETAS